MTGSPARPAGLDLRARHVAVLVVALGTMAVALSSFGRPWWCEAGDVRPWSGDVWSRHNSQHLVDPYTITHALHGIAMYGGLWLVLGKVARPLARLAVGTGVEMAWEIVENTDAMIERYRATTISLDYYGDSVVNSIGDVIAFVLGYLGASVLPVGVSVLGFFVVDGLLVLCIRDSLLLNMLMLLYPMDAVKTWQMRH